MKFATPNALFRFNSSLFAFKMGFVLGLFFAPKNSKCFVFNKSFGLFPLF